MICRPGRLLPAHNRRAKSRYADQRTSPEEGVSTQSIEEEKTMHVVKQQLFFGRPIRQRRADVGAVDITQQALARLARFVTLVAGAVAIGGPPISCGSPTSALRERLLGTLALALLGPSLGAARGPAHEAAGALRLCDDPDPQCTGADRELHVSPTAKRRLGSATPHGPRWPSSARWCWRTRAEA
jgi:hypothetical protein